MIQETFSKFQKATKLRREGKSYSEISSKLNIPKSTLSSWFSDEVWSQAIKSQLTEKWRKINTNQLIDINKSRKLQTLARHEYFRNKAEEEYRILKQNPLFLVALSLYWGEGEKIDKGRVSVINSDENMLELVVKFYRKVLKISEDKLRGAIFIYKDHDKHKALEYWSKKTQIPKNQFIKTQVLPSRSKITKRRVQHGICNVYFSSTEMSIKIRHWIKLLSLDMRV